MNQSDNSLVILCTFDVDLSNNTSWSSSHLFPRKWSDQTRLLVHPKTHYICEAYHLTASHLVANVSTTLSLSIPRQDGRKHQPWQTFTNRHFPTDTNSFQFFVPGLPAATTLRLKIFAQNSKGRSDYSWLRAATLRPAERLIDSQSTSSNGGSVFEESSNVLKGKPMLLMLVAAAFLLVLIVIVVGIIAFVKMNRTTHGSSSIFSSHLNSGSHLQSSQENDHLPSGDHHHYGPSNGPRDTFYKDELNDNCCCEDDCCDQMLLTQGSKDLRNPYQPSSDYQSSSKGPPDIIPSFGYVLDPTTGAATICGALGMDDKIGSEHFITYGNYFRYLNHQIFTILLLFLHFISLQSL